MNAIQTLAAQPWAHQWVERLGLTLLHFLWQGVIIASIYAAARKLGARSVTTTGAAAMGPNGRYLLACAALTAMAVAPLATWTLLRGQARESIAVTFTEPMSAARTEPTRFIALSLPGDADHAMPAPFLPWVVAIWFIGATGFSLRLLGGWILAERLRSGMAHPASAEWQQILDRLKTRVSVSRPVRLLVSGALHAPAAMGWLRPIVLVPIGALAGLPAAQMEALLLHELAHIRRHDYLLNILQSAIEAIFFYHPAVWWISGHMRAERELCCDDVAVSVTGDAVIYARALAEFDSARCATYTGERIQPAVMAANGGSLPDRIARLLGQAPAPRHPAHCGPGTILVLFLLAAGAWALFAQPTVRQHFEAASVKASLSGSVQHVRPLPGRLTADASLPILIQYAYGVQPFQVVGASGRIQAERYQIEALADGNANRDRMFLMLQSLLEDRFQLKTHRETRDLPVYALTAAKSGLKLPPPKEGGCVDFVADAPPEWAGTGRMAAPGEVAPAEARCGSVGITLGLPIGARIKGGKVGMPELVRMLSRVLGRSVIDKTGFTGPFDLQLDFVPDESTPEMPPPPPDSDKPGLSIQQALRQQLGLQLESTKGPVEVIVVDHAERPTAN